MLSLFSLCLFLMNFGLRILFVFLLQLI
jgi:hypothetical protein